MLTTPLSLTSLVVNGIIQARLGREQCPRSDAEKKKLQDLKPTLTTALARALGKGASSLPVPLVFLLVFP